MPLQSGDTDAPARVLLVGDDSRAAMTMIEMLRDAWPSGLLVTQTARAADAALELADHGDSAVLLHLGDDLAPLHELVTAAPDAAIVVVAERDDDVLGVAAVTAGAQDHLLRAELHPAMLTRSLRYARERKRAEVRLARQALEDPLTGLPNRALFLDRVGVALDRSQRTGLSPAVMFLDLDSFKQVNDSLGHRAGDHLLCTLSERFVALLRPMDTVARLGGDEFTFLFEGLTGPAEAAAIARRVGEAAAEPVALRSHGREVVVGASIGVAMLDDADVSPEQALADADTAMYRAKSRGGGRAEMHDGTDLEDEATTSHDAPEPELASDPAPAPRETRVRAPLAPVADLPPEDPLGESALRAALQAGELRVHYQPRVSIDGHTGLVGFEALLRWKHPERGLLVPSEFLEAAESSGAIVEIGDWVIGEALHQLRRWRQSRPGMMVSVNLSRGQLVDAGLAGRVRRRLQEAQLDPSALWLEVPEVLLHEDEARTAAALDELAQVGVGLALDGFGRGLEPAGSLGDLPLEMLKIDRHVVGALDADPEPSAERVRTVVALGHELALSVVAEGIETDHQLARVRDLGCDGAQGHLFSRPVPRESVGALLGFA